ncbi:hypothetical protein GGR57DRAFT_509046 [Xylariaceae sp. FL1272]|nr:hypothetical protein GGR57DRAFT_509046 [Xylariaceae sp. FL1272]
MKTNVISFAAVAAFITAVSAGGESESSSACAAQGILDSCISTTQGYIALCGSQDWGCLCEKYTSQLTCFDNCPSDSRFYGCSQQKELYCMNASAYGSKTTSIAKPTESVSSHATETAKPTEAAPTVESIRPQATSEGTTHAGGGGGAATAQTAAGPKATETAKPSVAVAGANALGSGAGAMAAVAGIAAVLL